MKIRLSFLLATFGLVASADQVTMKNGDRLTGAILKSDAKTLTIKSEYAGPVNLPWDAVVAITSSDPLSVGLQDGQVVVGQVTTVDGSFQVVTQTTGTLTITKDKVKSVRSKD